MLKKFTPSILAFAVCVLLAACGGGRASSGSNPYELPANTPRAGDNDSYYTQPSTYKGCTYINDAPSCGGG